MKQAMFKRIFTIALLAVLLIYLLLIFRISKNGSSHSFSKVMQQILPYYQLENPLHNIENLFYAADSNKINEMLTSNGLMIPLHYSKSGDLLVPVEINGHHLQFILDTGCSHSSLWKTVAPSVAKINNIETNTTIVGGEKVTDTFCKVPEMRLGRLIFHNVPMSVAPSLSNDDPKEIAGLLGGNILRNFVVTVDYKAKQLVLSSPCKVLHQPAKSITIPFKENGHVPFIEGSLDGKLNITLMVDTGSINNYAPEPVLRPLLKDPVLLSRQIVGLALRQNGGYVRLKSLKLGSLACPDPIFLVASTEHSAESSADHILLGNDFLSQFKVTFDYPNKLIIFEPYEHSAVTAPHCWIEGIYYLNHQNTAQAINAFNEVIKLESELRCPAYAGRGQAYMQLQQYQKAVDDYSRTISLDPKNAQVYLNRGIANTRLNNNQQAIKDLTEAIALGLKDADTYCALSAAHLGLGDNKRAIEDCDAALKLDPKLLGAYYNRSLAYGNLQQYHRAINDCSKVIELNAADIDAYDRRSCFYEKVGKSDLALKDRQKVHKLDKQAP